MPEQWRRANVRRPKDVHCERCGRPMAYERAWKRRSPDGRRTEYFCDEHIVLNTETHTWRVLEVGEEPPSEQLMPRHHQEQAAEELEIDAAAAVEEPPPAAADDDFDPLNDVGF